MAIKNKNPRIGTANNLTAGGTYDLLMITYPDGFPEGQIQFNIDTTPRKITGVQKVAQVFMKLLTTTKGSDPFYPNRGTIFPSIAINANRTTITNAYKSELVTAVNDATAQTRAALASDPDPSSRLARTQIAGIDVGEEFFVIYVQIVTASGTTAQVAVPFPELGLS